MADALASYMEDFERITKASDDDLHGALVSLLRHYYDLTEQEVLRNRVLVAEQVLVGVRRSAPREEEARQLARARTRDLEFAWAAFLTRAMEQGVIAEADPRLLARAVLGLHNSVWHWYRPGGTVALQEVSDFFVPRCLALLGLPAELSR
jgi:AcrR family transcriptional regulator